MKKLTIVIPVYNASSTILRCIKSLEKQAFKDFKVIFVNDGSTDESIESILNCSPSFSYKIVNQNNQGVSSARNTGLTLVDTEYVAFIDADDYVDKSYFEKMLNRMNSNIDLVVCGLKRTFYEGKKIVKVTNKSTNLNNDVYTYDTKAIFSLIQNESLNACYCKVYRSKIIKDNSIRFDVNLSMQEDLKFNITYLSFASKIACVNENLYYYVVSKGISSTDKYNKNRFSNLCNVFEVVKKFISNMSDDKDIIQMLHFIYTKNVWSSIMNTFFKGNKFSTTERKKEILRILHKTNYKYVSIGYRKGLKYMLLKHILLLDNITLIYFSSWFMVILRNRFNVTYS